MAVLGDALSALVRQIKFDKLDPLLGTGQSPGQAKPPAALTSTAVAQAGASAADGNVPTESLATGTRAAQSTAGQNAPGPAAPPATSVHTRLSADAALITALLGDKPDAATKTVVPMSGLDVSEATPEQIAKALVRSLATSGLFYESHLEEWVTGQRPLEALRAEPHNRLVQSLVRHAAAPALPAESVEPGAMTNSASAGTTATANSVATAPMPEALAAIVREQLDTLDFRRVHWQGEVWPQQQAELEIAENDARRQQDTEPPRAWSTTLRLDLPHLGAVEARIALDPHLGFGISVRAASDSLPALQSGRADFAAAMRDAGIALRNIEVVEHE